MTRVERSKSALDPEEGLVELHRLEDDRGREPKPSLAVIEAIEDAAERDARDADFQLYDRIDPEALDRLFGPQHDGTPRSGVGHVVFSVSGYRVTVTSDGNVDVARSDSDPTRCDRPPEDH